jgi:hypothetical protein
MTDADTKAELAQLASRIKAEHAAIVEATKAIGSIVQRAMTLGDMLAQAKSKLQHGEWLPYLKDNCQLSERTAQRYMAVGSRRKELEETLKDKSATVADFLTLKDMESSAALDAAVQNAVAQSGGGSGSSSSSSGSGSSSGSNRNAKALTDQVDTAIEKVIEKLKKLKQQNKDTAVTAAYNLLQQLRAADLIEEQKKKAA